MNIINEFKINDMLKNNIITKINCIFINKVLEKKYNIVISINDNYKYLIDSFALKFPLYIKNRIKYISKMVLNSLNKTDNNITIQEQISSSIVEFLGGNEEEFTRMINTIYNHNRDNFDEFARNIRNNFNDNLLDKSITR